MIDIAIDTNGNIGANKFGDIMLNSDDIDNIIQTANNSILMVYGENIYHTELGNDMYNNRIKISESGLEKVKEYCSDAILRGDSRIKTIVNLTAEKGEGTSCIINYTLFTTDGRYVDGRMSANLF